MPGPDLMRRSGIALTDYATAFNPDACLSPSPPRHPWLQPTVVFPGKSSHTCTCHRIHMDADVTFPGNELNVMR